MTKEVLMEPSRGGDWSTVPCAKAIRKSVMANSPAAWPEHTDQ